MQFNPYFWPTVDECLSHPFFVGVRKEEKELGATEKIKFDFEKEMLDKDRLRALILEEIDYFKNLNK